MINFWAVLASGVVKMILGFLWYGPLFGKKWMEYSNITGKDIERAKEKNMTWAYAWTFAGALVMATVLAHVLTASAVVGVGRGLMVGFGLWLGFIATTKLSSVFFEGKSCGYYWLNSLYDLVVLLVMSIILTLWK